jgi:carboxyl-terminal processing protease
MVFTVSILTSNPLQAQVSPSPESLPEAILNAAEPAISELLEALYNNRRYRDGLDDRSTTEAMLRGILREQDDPYVAVVDLSGVPRDGGSESARTADVGLTLDTDQYGRLRVAGVLPDSPAEGRGVRVGDFVLRVDGINAAGMTPWELTPRLASAGRVAVRLVVQSPGEEPRELTLEPEKYEVQTVTLRIGSRRFGRWQDAAEGDWAWLKVHAYLGETTEMEWADAIQEIWASPSVEGIVLDLRDNGGGDNRGIRTLGDFFMPGDELVRFRSLFGDEGWEEVVYNNAIPRSRLIAYPVVVLVNEHTASLAEIVAATLQEQRRVPVFGTRTYGKGTTQSWVTIENRYAVHLTTARWFTPGGKTIDGVGVRPDLAVTGDPLIAALRYLEDR